jgi:hypothetical protein
VLPRSRLDKFRRTLARGVLALVALAAPCIACSSDRTDPEPERHPLSPDEIALRAKLGVPRDAKKVMVFSQTAHLDIDWQKTFDEYYAAFVGDVLTEAGVILKTQPRAFYSVAEMAYLEHHLATHPDEIPVWRDAAQRGALRIVGGGMTTPDTLLPETELLFRDYLYGIQFAEERLGAHPRAAWLPDSFGHAGTVPDLLSAAGFTSVGFARIDGAPTLFEKIIHPERGPKPGSTAEHLQQVGSADFVWRGSGGAHVLAHYMTLNLYCTGDNIDYDENLQVPGGHIASFSGDDPAFTDGQIDSYLAALDPYAKTPYRFVTVGCDFQHPKPRLIEYLDGYNRRHYDATGVWAVAASFEDYEMFVSSWQDVLPEIATDFTPYYMGFYGSRAAVKRGSRDAARPFFLAETFATALDAEGATMMQSAAPALRNLTRANHHDFVTGTATDTVVSREQLPLLATAQSAGEATLAQVAKAIARRVPAAPGAVARVLALNGSGIPRDDVAEVVLPISGTALPVHAVANGREVPLELVSVPKAGDTTATIRLAIEALAPFSWRVIDLLPGATPSAAAVKLDLLDASGAPAQGGAVVRVVLSNTHVHAEWNAAAGSFALTSLVIDGVEAIARRSFEVRDYKDTGGLWRTGNEMNGCELTPFATAPITETLEVIDSTSLLVRVAFHSATTVREASLGAGATGLSLAVTTGAAEATTRTMALSLAVPAGATLTTSVAGGFAERLPERLYSPTFWPATEWASVGGWAILARQSTGVRMSTPGDVELMAVRDARSEQCDVEGGVGSDTAQHRIEWRIERAASPAASARQGQAFNRPISLSVVGVDQASTLDLPQEESLIQVEGEGIVTALKPAERGGGVVLRALLTPGPLTLHLPAALAKRTLSIVDAVERDKKIIGPAGATVVLDAASYGSIATIRLQ